MTIPLDMKETSAAVSADGGSCFGGRSTEALPGRSEATRWVVETRGEQPQSSMAGRAMGRTNTLFFLRGRNAAVYEYTLNGTRGQ